jgi:hypothetical protein
LETAEKRGEVRPVSIVFRGASDWLGACRRLVLGLPFVREGGDDAVIVTDEPEGPGWRFALNRRRLSPDLREFFWHAAAGPRAVELALFSEPGIECQARAPHYAGFHWRRDHASAVELAGTLLGLALAKKAGYGVSLNGEAVELEPGERPVSRASESWYRARKAARSLYLRTFRKRTPPAWRIAFHADADGAPPASGWQWLEGPAGCQDADPFLAREGEQQWLFFERMDPETLFGRLAAAPMFDGGASPRVILEAPHHMSYPCVFRHEGRWWMIPESEANRTVDLYRAKAFPHEWEKVRTLIQGPALVDTTPFHHEGRWYFFTTAIAPGRGLISLLFHAESLEAPWKLHPASPISMDAALSRGAGPIDRRDGRLIRPVQDCLESYGYAITLREIEQLTPTSFRERTLETILPDWHDGLEATHTIGRDGRLMVMDGLRRS